MRLSVDTAVNFLMATLTRALPMKTFDGISENRLLSLHSLA
jgi:hypothetical protein